jgi:cobalamin biosynthesis protein CobD/CbiB
MTGGTLGRTATVRAAGLALGMLADALPVVLAGSAMRRAARACWCARDATGLDTDDLARVTVESMAENTSDAVVAPLFWGALGMRLGGAGSYHGGAEFRSLLGDGPSASAAHSTPAIQLSRAVGVTAACLVVSGGLVLGWARR